MSPTVISIAALAVYAVSATFVVLSQDRPGIRAQSTFQIGSEGEEPTVAISIVNMGRRPIVLRLWRGDDLMGNTVGTYLQPPEGITLTARKRYDMRLRKADLLPRTPGNGKVLFRDAFFEDTLYRRFNIQGIRGNLQRLWNS
ncbi:uncharacterized protein (DUF58 family) [Variovorax boronicumulans]|uniref:Uncharacterized protein (DUF58 family) n=1 Tax=Variovorax boronicumulans TaxID=436515 RepID=A0AAW8DV37_9BURK|nr:hypothetical protein [Variovorax boronicumulans]MDP9877832.1 uncharacterized protein (DUF58 family) [Variovorax boronicumulans]MDP9923116.1 uncharacterized protein (DUF58 family) [Variovorax boronicumulans]